ncbi:MAG TPA: DUF1998 domain-containing protein, partial [Armatimonadetes bacterium]|nr:DUF1998 domain-containing protein [Armatimonadota bacterium]
EHALIDPDNPQIVVAHLRCAATELPLTLDELKEFGEYTPALIMLLEEMNELRHINDRWYWHGRGFPAADVDLRNIGENTYTIVDITAEPPRAIGTLDEYSAFKLVHPEAIYMHEGDTYFVEELNLDERVARVRRTDSDYFTWSVADTRIRIESSELHKRWRISDVHWGRVMVTETVFMFRRVKLHTWESLGYGRVSLPPVEIDTQAMWLIPPQAVLRHVREYQRNPAEAMLAVANVVAHVVPLFVMADMADVGALVDSANTGVPTLFVYDAHAGGIGFAQKAYELIEDILRAACELINSCPCEDGCPSCVGAPSWYVRLPQYIDGGDLIPDKEAAKVVLHDLLQLEPYTPKPKRWRDAQRQTAEATPSPLHTAKPLPEKIEAEIRRHIANIQQRRYRR